MSDRVERIEARLRQALQPLELDVRDDSHKHVGHAGVQDGRGHYHVRIVSSSFDGLASLARHRAVYAALETMMITDIHALAIDARAPQETTP
ncbi:MAG: BolA family protein [Dokdonella sp.]